MYQITDLILAPEFQGLAMNQLTQMRSHRRSFWAAGIAVLFAISGSVSQAQQDTGAGDGGGTQFQAEEVDLSAFEGVERGDSIGMATTQGFGLAAETTGGATAGGGGGGGGGFGGGLGGLFGALGNAFGGQGSSTQKPIIRVRLRSAIDIPSRPAEQIQMSARRTLDAAPLRSGMRGINVVMDGRTAVLSGVVGSEKDRRMSELLIRLEPGVSRVDNRVVVGN